MAVLISHQHRSVTCKYQNIAIPEVATNTYTRSLRNIKPPSDEAVWTRNPIYKILGMY